MSGRDFVDQACRALVAYRLRAVLSSIGIVFGIATVVTAQAIGEGARRQALSEIGALGIDNVLVRAILKDPTGSRRSATAPLLTMQDAQALQQRVVEARRITAVRSLRTEIAAGARRTTGALAGVTPEWADVVGLDLAQGRWLSVRDDAARRRVAVVGAALARALFPDGHAVGGGIQVGEDTFIVIGLLANPASSARAGSAVQRLDQSNTVLVPRTTMNLSIGAGDVVDAVEEIVIQTGGADEVAAAARAAGRVLRARGHEPSSYELVIPRELLGARLRAQRTFDVVLLSVGGLALLISGIGIMNIMLAAVAERTHEIGVRRAYGARRRDVLAQFTAEATLLCLVGGIAGVPLGALLSAAVALFAGWPVAISLEAVVIALVVSCAVGLACGIHPARLAARLEPAVALRAE